MAFLVFTSKIQAEKIIDMFNKDEKQYCIPLHKFK